MLYRGKKKNKLHGASWKPRQLQVFTMPSSTFYHQPDLNDYVGS
jgi:hypothetical protein